MCCPTLKLDFNHANASKSHLPYGEDVRICHTLVRHTGQVYRVIVGPDKFRQNVNISEGSFICKLFLYSVTNRAMRTFHDRTFHVGISALLKLYALVV